MKPIATSLIYGEHGEQMIVFFLRKICGLPHAPSSLS